ncbi:MAG: hypothetical protein JST50_15150 [Bacteroidetes bacterium]|jgi:hypothetical protein|nr:hypothetical protein [Bacteroidota bacterium]
MNICIIFFFTICILLLWVTIAGKELYPFSHYPMYSGPHDLKNIGVFRIAIEKKDGNIVWWQSEFYRYPEYSGRKLQQLWEARNNNQQQEVFLQLERHRLLISILQIMKKENINADEYNAFHIIERTINSDLKPVNKTVEIIPLNRLKR